MLQPRIATAGDNVVDCYPELGTMFPGGNTLNVSVFAARFGASSAYLGQIAADAAGDAISTALQDEGVDTSGLRRARAPRHTVLSGTMLVVTGYLSPQT